MQENIEMKSVRFLNRLKVSITYNLFVNIVKSPNWYDRISTIL